MSDETFARRFSGDRADLAKIGIEVRAAGTTETAETAESQLYLLSEDAYRLPAVEFTRNECRALSLALTALDGRFAYARPLRLALTAILRGREDMVRTELEQLPVALAPDEDARRAGKQLSRLEEAVTRFKTVRFAYPTADGDALERTIDPYSLFLFQGHWYVVGHDRLRDGIRTFRVGRIRGPVRFLTEKSHDFTVPPDYDPDHYRARPPWLIGPVRGVATVRVGEDLAWWVRRLVPHVELIAEEDDGCALVSMPYADESVLLSWIAGSGGCTELLEPARLRARLRDALLETGRAHAALPPKAGTAPPGPGDQSRPASKRGRPGKTAKATPRQIRDYARAGPIAPEHLARAIALLHYLVDEQRPSTITWETLENDLGLSRAEVQTDVSLINLMNFGGGTYVLTAEAGPEGIHVTRDIMADTFAEPARLSPVMARALLLALDLLGDTLALEGLESLASVREKVRALIGTDRPERAVIVDEMVPLDSEIVEVLNHAIRDHRLVFIDYFTAARQELGTRLVEPYLLFRSPDGWYLEGYCLSAQAQRTFKLERIKSATPTGESFDPRPEVDLTRRRTGHAFLPDDVAMWATVRFAPRWRTYLLENSTDCIVLPDGWVKAEIPYLDESWMTHQIVRYLGEAVLDGPPSARQRVCELARVLAARYEDAGPLPAANPPMEGSQ
ncbi:MAG: WYL domain-containing protein [Thermoleophilia bacterium]|nr:WYL domain-containing protein [Thermoleophilia bacterium]